MGTRIDGKLIRGWIGQDFNFILLGSGHVTLILIHQKEKYGHRGSQNHKPSPYQGVFLVVRKPKMIDFILG